MSLETFIEDVEAGVKKLNPLAITAHLKAIEQRITTTEAALARLAPTIRAVLEAVSPMLPAGTVIPAEVASLLALLPIATAPVGPTPTNPAKM